MTDPFSHWMENIPWPISYQISPCIVWCYPRLWLWHKQTNLHHSFPFTWAI